MARKSRLKSSTGIYLIQLEWKKSIQIIRDDSDFIILKNYLKKAFEKYDCKIYAYAFNKEKAYFLIHEHNFYSCSKVIQYFLSLFSRFYNKKYFRSGKISRDRYKSIPIENISHIPTIIAYIHKSCKTSFSSENEYLNKQENAVCNIKDFEKELIKLHSEKIYLPNEYKKFFKNNIQETINLIKKNYNINPEKIRFLPKEERNTLLYTLRYNDNISVSELQKILHISRSVIYSSTKIDRNISVKPNEEIWLL